MMAACINFNFSVAVPQVLRFYSKICVDVNVWEAALSTSSTAFLVKLKLIRLIRRSSYLKFKFESIFLVNKICIYLTWKNAKDQILGSMAALPAQKSM